MRTVVTGARGKVGRAVAADLLRHGHEVVATDRSAPVFERNDPDEPQYVWADLTDPAGAFQVIDGADAVVHCAAIPAPEHDVATAVFSNHLGAAFNVVEACAVACPAPGQSVLRDGARNGLRRTPLRSHLLPDR